MRFFFLVMVWLVIVRLTIIWISKIHWLLPTTALITSKILRGRITGGTAS